MRTPRPENCRFFDLAAQAEQAGFRPCLRCRPEVAPGQLAWSTQDATALLLQHALRLIASGAEGAAPVAQLAQSLGVSDRHLRRIFEARLGITPLQYLQTQRLLTAKHLLTDTTLSATQVALASGFGSVRRFNDAFARQYRLNPTQLRRNSAAPAPDAPSGQPQPTMALRLAYRPPLDTAALLGFFATRQIPGMEQVDTADGASVLRRTVRMGSGAQACSGWIALRFHAERFHAERFHPERCELLLEASDTLAPQLGAVMRRVRSMLDLDADPAAINARLHADFPDRNGLRVPGAWNGFETAVRAVLGQQITVAAARTLAGWWRALASPSPRRGQRSATCSPALRCWPLRPAIPSVNWASFASARARLPRWREWWIRASCAWSLAPTWSARCRNCAPCLALATGRRSTSPCGCCAGPTPFPPATWRCNRRWACARTRARHAPPKPLPPPGSPGAATPWCAPGPEERRHDGVDCY